jgi:hypothetical protein
MVDESRRRTRKEPMFLPEEGNDGQCGLDGKSHKMKPRRKYTPRGVKESTAEPAKRTIKERMRRKPRARATAVAGTTPILDHSDGTSTDRQPGECLNLYHRDDVDLRHMDETPVGTLMMSALCMAATLSAVFLLVGVYTTCRAVAAWI